MITELWSIKEKIAYTLANTTRVKVGAVYCLTTPKGELLVTKVR